VNAGPATCGACGRDARPREYLRCMLCGRDFHFASAAAPLADRDCGTVMPNPASENGC
jgi:hypothetical protein